MREPSPSLVVDAAVLIASVMGTSAPAFEEALRTRTLATTSRVVEEARRRIELGLKRPELLEPLEALLETVTVAPLEAIAHRFATAETVLRNAVASRNGSTADAHVLALAWLADADIWSPDRDFAGTGVASWSTPNLMRALASEDA